MHVWSKHNHWIQGMTLIITHFSLESKFGSSHLISLPFMPSDTQGSNKGPPQLSVPNQLLDAVPAVPKILISVLTVHCHVFLGLPCLCLPSVKCCIRTESLSLSWWPTYLHHLCRMMVPKMHSSLHCISRSLLQIVWGQRICKIFSQTFGVVGWQLSQISFCHLPAFWPIQKGYCGSWTWCMFCMWWPPDIV